jgi:hypothetical protein
MRVALFCTLLLISDIGLYLLACRSFDSAAQKYKEVVEVQQNYTRQIQSLKEADQRILAKLIQIDERLDRRIGDGPNTGDAPK